MKNIVKALLVLFLLAYSQFIYATCSADYKGKATINEIGMDKQNFIEIKLLDGSILASTYQSWSVGVCKSGSCSTFPLAGMTVQNLAYLVISTTKELPKKHEVFDVILQDGDGNTIDYLNAGLTTQQDNSCTLDYDWQVDLGVSHNYRRMPDGTGDWEDLGDHGFDYTPGESNDGGLPPTNPGASCAIKTG